MPFTDYMKEKKKGVANRLQFGYIREWEDYFTAVIQGITSKGTVYLGNEPCMPSTD